MARVRLNQRLSINPTGFGTQYDFQPGEHQVGVGVADYVAAHPEVGEVIDDLLAPAEAPLPVEDGSAAVIAELTRRVDSLRGEVDTIRAEKLAAEAQLEESGLPALVVALQEEIAAVKEAAEEAKAAFEGRIVELIDKVRVLQDGQPPEEEPEGESDDELMKHTKAELLEMAAEAGVEAKADDNKSEIVAAIREAEAAG